MKQTRVLIFDFWGTLVENGVWSPTKQVQEILGVDIPFSEFVLRFEKAFMVGTFQQLRDGFEAVCREFEISPGNEKIEELVGLWNKNWMLAQLYPETEEVLAMLQHKFELVLISNTDGFSVRNALEKFGLRKYFRHVFFSFEMGMLKTDEKFYPHILKLVSARAEMCAVIGDSIESDMLPAKEAGLQTILADRKDRRVYAAKVGNLSEVEGMVK